MTPSLLLVTDTASPSQQSPVAAQNVDLDNNSDSQGTPPPAASGNLRIPTFREIRGAMNDAVNEPSWSQEKRGDLKLNKAHDIMSNLDKSEIEDTDLRTFEEKFKQ
jgi:hypothetical protein